MTKESNKESRLITLHKIVVIIVAVGGILFGGAWGISHEIHRIGINNTLSIDNKATLQKVIETMNKRNEKINDKLENILGKVIRMGMGKNKA